MKKYLILIGVLLSFITLVVILFTKYSNNSGYSVTFKTVPESSTVYINDKKIKLSGGKTNLVDGDYDIRISKDGFGDYNTNISIHKNQTIIALLEPITDEANEWANKNKAKYSEIESLAAELNQQSGQNFIDRNPIVSILPINRGYYRIDYGLEENDDIFLEIRSDSAIGRIMALNEIRDNNYKISDYRIYFIDLKNPFIKE